MAYLLLKSPSPEKAKVRPAYALAGFGTSKSAIAQFPKKGAGDIAATINGKPVTIRLGDASKFSKSGKLEFNGYVRRERNSPDFTLLAPDRPADAKGGLYWFSFEAGFDPRDPKLKLSFAFVDETCPTPNPKREPANPKAEEARIAGFKNWAATKAGGVLVARTNPYDSTDPYFAVKVAADWDAAIGEEIARNEAEKAAEAEAAEKAKAESEAAKSGESTEPASEAAKSEETAPAE